MLTSHGKAQSDQISAEGLMELLASGASDIQLLDVRELDEWEAGYIEGADHCPLSLLLQGFRPDNLKKNATLVLYCRSGVRSMQAFHILKSQGYADLRNMMGGYEAWRRLSVRAA
jgi:rhodanese-related sulfurtransferase